MADTLSQIKYWNGSSYVIAKAVRVWNGAAWVNRVVKVWNGSAWVDRTTQVYEFVANLSDSLCPGSYTYAKWRSSNDDVYQGIYNQDVSMNNMGFAWFDTADAAAKLSGRVILKVEAYLWRQGYGVAGNVGVHIWGQSMPASLKGDRSVSSLAIGEGYISSETVNAILLPYTTGGAYGDVSNTIGEGLRDGTRTGFATYVDAPHVTNDYMIMDGYDGTNPPKLRITCI